VLRIDLVHGRKRAQHTGIPDEDVELLPAFGDGPCQAWECRSVTQVERYECRFPARGTDGVVEFLEAADRAGDGNDVGAFARELKGDGAANPAGGACYQRRSA
jgi:hypothetical protein